MPHPPYQNGRTLFEAQAEMIKDHGPTEVMRNEHRQIKYFLEEIQTKVATGDLTTEEAEQGSLRVLTATM